MLDEHLQEYVESMRRFTSGEAVSYDTYLRHLELQNSNISSGVAVGEKLPPFRLRDQSGAWRTIEDLSGPNGLLLVLVRTVSWCGYCRNQLAELNHALDEVQRHGVRIAALSSDTPEVVGRFAGLVGLRYPMLADPGAESIERMGVLNTNIPRESELQNGGRIAFPGHFLLAPDGTVREKLFTDDLRHRPSGTQLVFEQFGPANEAGGAGVEIRTPEFHVRIALSTARLQMGQEFSVLARFSVEPGWHLYGSPVPQGYTALALQLDDTLLARQDWQAPEGRRMRLEAVGEEFPVLDGVFDVRGRIRLRWSPPVHGTRHLVGLRERLESMQIAPGDHVVRGALHYQACSDQTCAMPASIPFELPVRIEPDTDKAEKVFKGE